MRFVPTVIVTMILVRTGLLQAQAVAPEGKPSTAWNDGYPGKGLKNADELVAWFKDKGKHLGKDGKLRILIIGDSLSDGYYHWSHHFRRDLQAAYGDGGYGAVWSIWAQGPQSVRGWLWDEKKELLAELTGRWRRGWGGRGDVWPYLGWNGDFLATDLPDAQYKLEAKGSTFTVVYSTGTFTTFNGQTVQNRSAAFEVNLDDQTRAIPAAKDNELLDIGLARFEVADGPHTLRVGGVKDGTIFFHGTLVENAAPGVVVYNISHGGWWAHNYIWRQPGFEKILAAMKPDLTIIFMSKPESGGSTSLADAQPNSEYEMLTKRVLGAVPNTKLLYFKCWEPRDGISRPDAQTLKDRTAWFEANHHPYLDLPAGLNPKAMKELGWFQDNIHQAPPGGEGIGKAIARLFVP